MASAAPGAILVSPENLSGWEMTPDTSSSYYPGAVAEFIPVTGAPLGLGALHMLTEVDATYRAFQYNLTDAEATPLADLAASYASQRLGGPEWAAPGMFVAIDGDGDLATTDDTYWAVYEPIYNGGTNYDVWNTWQITADSQFWYFDPRPNPGGPFTTSLTVEFSDLPNALITSYVLNQGTGNEGWDTLSDAVSFVVADGSQYLFDLDPDPLPAPEPGLPATGSTVVESGVTAIGIALSALFAGTAVIVGVRRRRSASIR